MGFEIEVTLPSKGKLNPEIPDGKVVIKGLTVQDESDFLGAIRNPKINSEHKRLQAISQVLREIIGRNIVKPKVDVNNLLWDDFSVIAFKQRIDGYGPEYEMPIVCKHCGFTSERVQLDLTELPFTMPDVDKPFKEPHQFKLGDYTIMMNYARVKDESKISQNVIMDLIAGIVDKDGKEIPKFEWKELIMNMPARYNKELLKQRNALRFGFRGAYGYTCPECGTLSHVDVDFNPVHFFRLFDE